MLKIMILDTSFTILSIVDYFESFIWTDRYNSPGDFELYLPIAAPAMKYVKLGNYLWVDGSDRTMIIERIEIESDEEDGAHVTVTGRSLESILARRIIWENRTYSGNLQTAVSTILSNAIISPSNSLRKIDNFIFEQSTDERITSLTIEETKAYGRNVLEVIQSFCQDKKIGFKVTLNDSNQFVFSLYKGVDRSYNQTNVPYVIFSPMFDNMLNSNYYTSTEDYANVVMITRGDDKTPYTVGDASGLERREACESASSDDGQSVCETQGKKYLSEHPIRSIIEGEVDATHMYIYRKDFFIGDIVQFANEYGMEGTAYISEYVYSQSSSGIQTYPTFTTTDENINAEEVNK